MGHIETVAHCFLYEIGLVQASVARAAWEACWRVPALLSCLVPLSLRGQELSPCMCVHNTQQRIGPRRTVDLDFYNELWARFLFFCSLGATCFAPWTSPLVSRSYGPFSRAKLRSSTINRSMCQIEIVVLLFGLNRIGEGICGPRSM